MQNSAWEPALIELSMLKVCQKSASKLVSQNAASRSNIFQYCVLTRRQQKRSAVDTQQCTWCAATTTGATKTNEMMTNVIDVFRPHAVVIAPSQPARQRLAPSRYKNPVEIARIIILYKHVDKTAEI